jgi:hypothetical protein
VWNRFRGMFRDSKNTNQGLIEFELKLKIDLMLFFRLILFPIVNKKLRKGDSSVKEQKIGQLLVGIVTSLQSVKL